MIGDIVENYLLSDYIPKNNLSKQEFYELITKYQKNHDDQIKEKLIQGNLKLVMAMTRRFYNKTSHLEDLFQVGIIGLMKAIDHFDTSYQLQFSTYAVPLIIGEMKRYLRDNHQIRISRHIKDLAYAILKISDEYMALYQREPTIEELADILKTEKKQIVEAMLSTNSIASFQETVGQDDDMTLIDAVSEDVDIVEKYQHHLDLENALTCLNAREKLIIKERYFQGLSQCEIAEELFISQAQVSRIEKKALEKLHKKLE